MACTPDLFLKAIAPYREDMAVPVECIFTWYWPADLCGKRNIPFVLGHALYMKAIHGGKAKNDKIDAHKIAVLLRGGMLPMAYVYPALMRSTRDLLRRRMHLMRKRSELLAHIQNTNSRYCLPQFGKKIAYKANRQGVCEHFTDSSVRKSMEMDLLSITTTNCSPRWSSTSPRPPRSTTLMPFSGCARCTASVRSWPWSFSTRSMTSTASRQSKTLSPMPGWSNAPKSPQANDRERPAKRSVTSI